VLYGIHLYPTKVTLVASVNSENIIIIKLNSGMLQHPKHPNTYGPESSPNCPTKNSQSKTGMSDLQKGST